MGLIFGSLVCLICLTGSVIVFRQEADRPFRTVGPPRDVSLDAAALEIGRLMPSARITRIRFPIRSDEPYVFQVRTDNRTRRVALDASSGRVLGEMPRVRWMEWMIDLHRNLLAGRPGRKVIGGVGISGLTLSATALLLWLSSGPSWRALVTIRGGSSRRFNFELHRTVGLWALCFVAVVSVTGIGLSYSQALRDAWERVTGQPASVRSPGPMELSTGSTTPLVKSLDKYLATGRTAIPDGAPTELRIPESLNDPIVIRFRRAGDLSATGNNRIFIGPVSGLALATDLAANWSIGVRLFQSLAPIHYGEFGNFQVKVVWSIFGVAPSILYVSGMLIWLRPGRLKSRKRVYVEPSVVDVPVTEPVRR
jgi:uncharacterized iron-regulated membrane protein